MIARLGEKWTTTLLGSESAAPRAKDWIRWIVLAVVGFLVCFLRLSAASWNVPWAEDATTFLTTAAQRDPLTALVTPYAGYLHTLPRLASAVVVELAPPSVWPLVLTIVACALTAFIATATIALLGGRIGSPLLEVALWVGIVASPLASVELNGSIANIHWYLLIGAFTALAARQRSPALIAIAAMVVLLSALSDPLTLVLLPLWIVQTVSIRTIRQSVVPLAFAVGMSLQLIAVLGSTLAGSVLHPTIGALARATAYRVFLGAVAGRDGAATLYAAWPGFAFAAVLTICILVAVAAIRGSWTAGLAPLALVFGVVLFAIATWLRWSPSFDPNTALAWEGSRYAFAPQVLVLVAIAASIVALTSAGDRSRFAAAAALLALLIVIAAPGYLQQRPGGDDWAAEMHAAELMCTADPSATVTIRGAPAGWNFGATCHDLGLPR